MHATDSACRVPLNNRPFKSPRKLRVVCIGAGFAGLTLAYKISHELKLEDVLDFQIYERQHSVGGTWLANQYPGLTCDVPIHVYTLPWAPKHDWTSFMASGEEIRQYVSDTAKKFDLNRFVAFSTTLESAVWDAAAGKWNLTLSSPSSPTPIHSTCDILIGASGTQSTPIKPDIPGLDTFSGQILHTGSWPDSTPSLPNKRIAVIGNGSSGIQAVGALQPSAAHITHYIRAATWISMNYMSQFTPDGANFAYTPADKARYKDPVELFAYRLALERVSNGIFKNLVFNETCPDVKKVFRAKIEELMRSRLKGNEAMIGKLVPSYQPWCRRLTPGDAYLDALQAENASLVDEKIVRVVERGIVTEGIDELLQEHDVIVLATGFRNTRVPPWEMRGREGVLLSELWTEDPDGYISVAAPGMPNYFSIGCGPNFTIANGPVLSAFGFMAEYVLKWCVKVAGEGIKSVVVRDEVVREWNVYVQEIMRRTAWNDSGCGSWYKKKKGTGRGAEYGDSKGEAVDGEEGGRTGITAIYPGSMNHFREMLGEIRGEDFEIEYLDRRNRWAQIVGNGLTRADVEEGQEMAPYLERTWKGENMMSYDDVV